MTPREAAVRVSSPPIPGLIASLGWAALGLALWDWRRKDTDW